MNTPCPIRVLVAKVGLGGHDRERGIIPEEDRRLLQEMGAGRLFAPGSHTHEIAEYIREWVTKNKWNVNI